MEIKDFAIQSVVNVEMKDNKGETVFTCKCLVEEDNIRGGKSSSMSFGFSKAKDFESHAINPNNLIKKER